MIKTMAMVSSTVQPSSRSGIGGHIPGLAAHLCNTGAAQRSRLIRGAAALALVVVMVSVPHPAFAQADLGWFLAGAATSLGVHESGHLVSGYALGADPGFRKVSFGPFPFFAITHDSISPAREFTISSAGFWMQHLSNELILLRRPALRYEDAPFIKGMLAFNVLMSAGYATVAFARAGPLERDTRGMAVSARMSEPAVGALILVPAALDAVRYYAPERRWLAWTSRAVKVVGVLLVIRAAD